MVTEITDLLQIPEIQGDTDLPYPYQLFDPTVGERKSEYIFSFTIPDPVELRLALYDTSGSVIQTIVEGQVDPGFHFHVCNLEHLEDGVYVCILSTSNLNFGIKLILKN